MPLRLCNAVLLITMVSTMGWAQALQTIATPAPDTTSPADTIATDSLDTFDSHHSGPDTVDYKAEELEYDVASKTFTLMSKAQLQYHGASLSADTIWLDQDSSVLQASGRPILRDKANPPIAGYRMRYNGSRKIGQVWYGASYRDGQQFHGMDIKRLPDGRLFISRGDFSTCDTTDQHYFFYARRMMVKPKESVTARPVVLNISDVPVAVLPILVSPLKSGRRSGLLTPKFGGDQSQGFYLRDLGFYWAASDYWDFTVRSEVVEGESANFSNSNLQGDLVYKKRYILDGTINGKAYLEEFDPANSGWEIRFSHNQNITPDQRTKLAGAGSFVSSQSLRKDKGLDAETVLDQEANAHLTFSQRFKNNSTFSARVQQDYNLTTGYQVRQLPDLQYQISGPLIPENTDDTTVYWYNKFNYSYSNHINYRSAKAPDTTLDIDTTNSQFGYKDNFHLDYSGQIFDFINVTPKADFSNNWSARRLVDPYDSTNTDTRWAFDPSNGDMGAYFFQHQYSINTDTKLYGIWRPEIGRFVGVRHTVSPNVSYTYAPEIDTNKYFALHPSLGQSKFQTKQKTVGMGLANDFDLKYFTSGGTSGSADSSKRSDDGSPPSANLRLLSVKSSTSYNFAADSFQWSTIGSSVTLQPIQNIAFTVSTVHNVYHLYEDNPSLVRSPQLTQYSYELGHSFQWNGDMNAGLRPNAGKYEMLPWSANLYYRFGFSSTRVGREVFKDQATHSAGGGFQLRPSQAWSMKYNTQYDFTADKFASHVFGFSRTLHCWKMDFDWTPVGPSEGWHFQILVTDLPDIKLQASSQKTN